MRGAGRTIIAEATAWEGVIAQPGRFGSTQFVVGKREVGHVHGDSVVDIPCRKEKCQEWIAAGRAEPHRFAPVSVCRYSYAMRTISRTRSIYYASHTDW